MSDETKSGQHNRHDRAAELAVLKAILLDDGRLNVVRRVLAPEDFYDPLHRRIFEVACSLYEDRQPIDAVTLRARLEQDGRPDTAQGVALLPQLFAGPPPSFASVYVRIVRGDAHTRRLHRHHLTIPKSRRNTYTAISERPATANPDLQRFFDAMKAYGEDLVAAHEVSHLRVKGRRLGDQSLTEDALAARKGARFAFPVLTHQLVGWMFLAGLDPNAPVGDDGETMLHQVCGEDTAELVPELLARGARTDIRDADGGSPLHHAADVPYGAGAVAVLVAAGADLNARDKDGRTPLHRAVIAVARHDGDPKVVTTLVTEGADITMCDRKGRTPLDIASRNDQKQIVGILSTRRDPQGEASGHAR